MATIEPVSAGAAACGPGGRTHGGETFRGRRLRAGNRARLAEARAQVDRAKVALGERGPVWWDDGGPDLNRHLVVNTPYADWLREQDSAP